MIQRSVLPVPTTRKVPHSPKPHLSKRGRTCEPGHRKMCGWKVLPCPASRTTREDTHRSDIDIEPPQWLRGFHLHSSSIRPLFCEWIFLRWNFQFSTLHCGITQRRVTSYFFFFPRDTKRMPNKPSATPRITIEPRDTAAARIQLLFTYSTNEISFGSLFFASFSGNKETRGPLFCCNFLYSTKRRSFFQLILRCFKNFFIDRFSCCLD